MKFCCCDRWGAGVGPNHVMPSPGLGVIASSVEARKGRVKVRKERKSKERTRRVRHFVEPRIIKNLELVIQPNTSS